MFIRTFHGLHERVAATGQDDDAIVGVRTNHMKQIDKLFMDMSVEEQRAAVSVKRHFEYARFRAGQPSIGETGAISVETRHYRTSTSFFLHDAFPSSATRDPQMIP
jgi:hypothetical protein